MDQNPGKDRVVRNDIVRQNIHRKEHGEREQNDKNVKARLEILESLTSKKQQRSEQNRPKHGPVVVKKKSVDIILGDRS